MLLASFARVCYAWKQNAYMHVQRLSKFSNKVLISHLEIQKFDENILTECRLADKNENYGPKNLFSYTLLNISNLLIVKIKKDGKSHS